MSAGQSKLEGKLGYTTFYGYLKALKHTTSSEQYLSMSSISHLGLNPNTLLKGHSLQNPHSQGREEGAKMGQEPSLGSNQRV